MDYLNNKLLDELKSFGKNHKATYVYKLCLKKGKLNLANKIRKKYNFVEERDDLMFSMQILLNLKLF